MEHAHALVPAANGQYLRTGDDNRVASELVSC